MKILEVKSLNIPDVKVIRYQRFTDNRGYFAEHFRKSDFAKGNEMDFFQGKDFLQANESFSKKNVARGLHFQWNPYMGKLVRTLQGRMVDLVLDIRKGSPTYRKIVAYDMPADPERSYDEWIWIPVGFAHGNFFTQESVIEYFCTGDYSPGCEAGISPLAPDLDWSSCDSKLKAEFDELISQGLVISDKDKAGLTLSAWEKDERSENFIYPGITR